MQCKAIELLEVLLEETDEKHSSLLKAISKDLQTDHIIDYIKNMYDHYVSYCYIYNNNNSYCYIDTK